MKQRVLVVVHVDTFFNELRRVGKMLRASNNYEPVFLFPHYYPTLERDVNHCLDDGFVCLDHRGNRIVVNNVRSMRTFFPDGRIKSRLNIFLQRTRLLGVIKKILTLKDVNNRNYHSLLFELWYLRHRINYAKKVYRKENIRLVIVGGDAVHYDTHCFIRAAHQHGIPSVIVPCTMSNAIEMAESYSPIPQYHLTHWPNRLFARFFPRWVYVHKGRPLLRLPASQALALELLHLAPPLPWMALSGYADIIATESEAMVEYYTRDGIPRSQLEVTGSLADDELFHTAQNSADLRRRLFAEHRLSLDRPMLLSALPPNQLYMAGGRPECEFSSYQELVEFWINALLMTTGYNIVLSLHPSLRYEDFKHYESPRLAVSRINSASLIPLADIFVASVSTIIRWAILTGKPVVNWDVYRYRYNDYTDVPGVVTIEKKNDFVQTVLRLASDGDYRQSLIRFQTSAARTWGMLDGHVSTRMISLFDRLLEHYAR